MILGSGAVNGVPTKINLGNAGVSPVTIPYFPAGASSTLAVDTDGINGVAVSHRVAIVVGDTIGRDHFSFPVATSSPDPTKDGFPTNLDGAMKWFWLVKKWHIEVYEELSQDEGGDNQILSISADFDVSAATPIPSGTAPDVESRLVVPVNLFQSFSDGDNVLNVTLSPKNLTKQTGDNFFFPILIHAINEDLEMTLQNTDEDLEEGGPVPDTNGDNLITWDGVQNKGYYFLGSGRSLVSASVTATPTEFWAFATKAGDAVYDTSDGSTLNDPLS